ncbi:MAG: flagellar basal-body MS-ring/collar protein FliF [Pseudomonadota bacterium]
MPPALQQIIANLQALGTKRLATLGLATVLTLSAIAAIGLWASQPATVTLYSNLQRDDVNRIGPALAQAGLFYDVSSDGTAVMVAPADAGRARMILAEQGLPRSTGSGYELFETMGSLGLTSFMQRITQVRALEGEIARSVRLVEGVRSARVHIVMADRSNFASRDRKATASVLLQTDARMNPARADAIRHLVAAAVPGLASDDVTVTGASGRLLASGADPTSGSASGKLAMQRMVEARLAESASRVLEPWLGAQNFRVSVQADLNTDELRTEETTFDPDSRVERSVQVVKTEESNTERGTTDATTVAQDIPEEAGDGGTGGNATSQASERREETTNYEINSKRTATVRTGYSIASLSASIVVNRAHLDAEGALDEAALEAKLEETRATVLAALGFNEARGDMVNVAALPFVDEVVTGSVGASLGSQLMMQAGSIVRALSLVGAVALVLLLGWRPAVRMVLDSQPALTAQSSATNANLPAALSASLDQSDADLPIADRSAQQRLQALADRDEERAAEVLRAWLAGGGLALDEPAAT